MFISSKLKSTQSALQDITGLFQQISPANFAADVTYGPLVRMKYRCFYAGLIHLGEPQPPLDNFIN